MATAFFIFIGIMVGFVILVENEVKVEQVVPGDGLIIPRLLIFYGGIQYDRLCPIHAHEVDKAVVGGICLWVLTSGAYKAVKRTATVSMFHQEDVLKGEYYLPTFPAARLYTNHHPSFIILIIIYTVLIYYAIIITSSSLIRMDMSSYSDQIAQVSTALSDPTRREIMEHVLHSDSPLSVREVAEHFGLHSNAARLHLDKLAKGGLLKIVRRRGARGGRPAHLYTSADQDCALHIPARSYKLLADILVEAVRGQEKMVLEDIERKAFRGGREEGLRSSSPLAYLASEAETEEVVQAWLEDIERRGLKAIWKAQDDGKIEVTFLSCPFGDLSSRHPELVCEIHRLMEEGFLSLAGGWRLKPHEESHCTFHIDRTRQE